ncbi:MAG TPA: hypothetical protein VLF60_02645 [Candidatus Saccharimonadales bacterium]|nr:hypothetical protein [Candidatus Saccharimonadales bacterium]
MNNDPFEIENEPNVAQQQLEEEQEPRPPVSHTPEPGFALRALRRLGIRNFGYPEAATMSSSCQDRQLQQPVKGDLSGAASGIYPVAFDTAPSDERLAEESAVAQQEPEADEANPWGISNSTLAPYDHPDAKKTPWIKDRK